MNYSVVSMLGEDDSLSRRKSSWSNYLNKPEDQPSERSAHPQVKKLALPLPSQPAVSRYQYNIEDFLPKPYKSTTYTSVDIADIEDDLNPPFVLTARFPEAQKQLKQKKSVKEEMDIREEWKAQKAEIDRLREAVEKIERSKPTRKALGWSQRIEIKVTPTPVQVSRESKATETDQVAFEEKPSRSPSIQIPSEGLTRPAPKTTRQTMTAAFNNNDAAETVYRNNTNRPHLTEKQLNIPLIPIRDTNRQPLKRVRKEYTELYAIRVDQITDTVMALLRYQND